MSLPDADYRLCLYSTSACHLCEQAIELLLASTALVGWQLDVIDIAEDDQLVSRYGERIPVLERLGEELDWPFDEVAVVAFCMNPAVGRNSTGSEPSTSD